MSNGKMIPVRVGSVPSEATKQGALNESLSPAEKLVAEPAKLDKGPKRDEKGAFLPASYETKSGSIRTDR